jgi:hypothetical protein
MKYVFVFLLGILLGIIVGLSSINIYSEFQEKEELRGLRLTAENWTDALNISHSSNEGNWICVRVNDITPTQALEICQHEVAHEIFATYCQTHFNECVNLTLSK